MDKSLDARKLVGEFARNNKDVPELKFIVEDPEEVTIEALSGGLVNYVFRVRAKDGKHSVVLKYAQETARGMHLEGLSMDRQRVEFECLKYLGSVIPGKVPEAYCLDQTRNIIALQDLSDWELLGHRLQTTGPELSLASELGRVLAKMHSTTWKKTISTESWRELTRFRQTSIKEMQCHMMLEKYYYENGGLPEQAYEAHGRYSKDIVNSGLQTKATQLFNEERCLVQVDSHWNSVFVKNGHVALFDFEGINLGHPGTSIAFYVGSFLVCFLIKLDKKGAIEDEMADGQNDELKLKFEQAVHRLLSRYIEGMGDIVKENVCLFMSEIALFCGALLYTLAVSEYTKDLDDAVTPEVQISMLHKGYKLMKKHENIQTLQQLVTAIFEK